MNIAEKLKGIPKGTKLYSPMFGDVFLVLASGDFINVHTGNPNHTYGFNKEGKFSEQGDCMLFPSRENRDWSNFKVDLPEGASVMVSSDKIDWSLRFYHKNKRAYNLGNRCGNSTPWGYIVPVDKFDFNNITFDIEDNYGTANC